MEDQTTAFAAYFNVARHNLLLVLNGIARKAGLSEFENDAKITNHCILNKLQHWSEDEAQGKAISDQNIRLSKQVIQGLQKALPILQDNFLQNITGQKIYAEIQYQKQQGQSAGAQAQLLKRGNKEKSIRTGHVADYYWVLDCLVKALNQQRNYYTHAYQNKMVLSDALANLLGIWFDAARRESKNRFGFSQDDVKHLLRVDLKTKKENPKAHYALTLHDSGERYLTKKGTAFFCCLFLDTQQGYELLKQLSGFKQDTTHSYQATLRTFTHYHARLPFVRIDTDSTPHSLGLDIFGELARCPLMIYEHLSDERQKDFAIGAEAQDDWLLHPDAPNEAHLITRFVRHSDRFPVLMMRYFDQVTNTNDDPGIRFQLDLGDFYFKTYSKNMPDGSSEIRRLKQKILRFGLLSQAHTQTKPEGWLALERVNAERDYDKPYIVQTQAHYHLPEDNHSIPVKLAQNSITPFYTEPKPDPENPQCYQPFETQRPDFWLSPYELVNLAFYHHLRVAHALPENQYPKVGYLLQQYQSNLRLLYRDMQSRSEYWCSDCMDTLAEKLKSFCLNHKSYFYSLKPQDLPKDLQRLLLSKTKSIKQHLYEKANHTLQLLYEDGEARLYNVDRAKKSLRERMKPGKPGYRILRAGEMATFLAKDMLRLQPVQDEASEHKGKPTSIMADLLQARLAYFGRDKTCLPALFNSLKLTGNPEAVKNHPFLPCIKVADMEGIAQFYQAYLEKRQQYLKDMQNQFDWQNPALGWLKLSQMDKRLQGKDNVAVLVGCYLNRLNNKESKEPLNLPRGLFRELTLKALLDLDCADLNKAIQGLLDRETSRKRPTSTSQLIKQYVLHVHSDDVQSFYHDGVPKLQARIDALKSANWKQEGWVRPAERELRKASCKKAVNESLEQQRKQRIKKLHNTALDLGRSINYCATQDQILYLAARALLDVGIHTVTDKNHGDNAAVGPLASGSVLGAIRLKDLKRQSLEQDVSYCVSVAGKTIYTEAIKAKNIGQFKYLSRDRRLPGVLHYYPATCVPLSVVVEELKAYPRAQRRALSEILKFEQQQNQYQERQASSSGGLHRTLLEEYLKQCNFSEENRKKLVDEILVLRNAFCHNQLPVSDKNKNNPLATPMLQAAWECLTQIRQRADTVIKDDNSVAQYFANILIQRYQCISAGESSNQSNDLL